MLHREIEELKGVKKAHDKLVQELIQVKSDRDQLFPVCRNFVLTYSEVVTHDKRHSNADRSRGQGVSRLLHML